MATFGTTGYTFNYDLGTADSVVLGKYTLTEAGTLTALRIAYYNSSTSSSGSFKLVIYDDDGTAGAPGTRLFLGSPIYCDADSYSLALDSTLNLPLLPGSYWLGAVLRDTYCVATAAATTGGTHGIYTASGAYTNPPSTLPTLTSSGTYTVEVLATYTPDLRRVVSAGLVAEYVGKWAKVGSAPGNNSDPTSTWDDLTGVNDGTAGTFAWNDTTSGWDGDGSVADPYRLLMNGDGTDNVRSAVEVVKNAGTTGFTFEAWMRVPEDNTTWPNPQCAVCQIDVGGTYQVAYIGFSGSSYPNKAILYYRPRDGSGVTAQQAITVGSGIHHIVGTLQTGSGNMKVYVDGSNSGATNGTANTPTANDSYNLGIGGMYAGSWSYPYKGEVATARVYARPLTASEVAQNYAAGPTAASTQDLSSLIAFGRF